MNLDFRSDSAGFNLITVLSELDNFFKILRRLLSVIVNAIQLLFDLYGIMVFRLVLYSIYSMAIIRCALEIWNVNIELAVDFNLSNPV